MSKNNMIRTETINEETILPNKIEQIQFQLPLFQSLQTNQTNKTEKNKLKEKTNFHFIIKKRGRRIKYHKIFKSEEKRNVHDKFSNDNIKRRIKTLYNKYIITSLNNIMRKQYKKSKMKFLKMNIKVTKDIGIQYNKNLLNQPIKDIIINVSNKYQNKENNKNAIKFIKTQKNNEEILNILNLSYKELFTNYYLKSTKNDSSENSFEADKEKLLMLYGKQYLDKFIENAEHFVEFFLNSKNRRARKFQEIDSINIPLKNEKIETTSNSNDLINNDSSGNKDLKINTVSTSTQTDLGDINSKLIFFS